MQYELWGLMKNKNKKNIDIKNKYNYIITL